MRSLITICCHTKLLWYHCLYSLCYLLHSHDFSFPFTIFTHPPVQATFSVFSVSMSVSILYFSVCSLVSGFFCFVFYFFLDSTFKRNHTVFIFLWLISLSLTSSSRCIHVVANGKILCIFILGPLFHCIYICLCVSHLLYAFFCWWTPRLLSYFSYCR